MSILTLILTIALVGFVVWLILQIPMPEQFRKIILAVVALLLIVFVLQGLGLVTGLPTLRLR